jgi:hypothetical protein
MEISRLLRYLVEVLGRMGVRYYVTGSVASISYGEFRSTNDIDVVVELRIEHVEPFCAAFPEPDYYLSAQAVRDAVRRRFQFNILEPDTGMKVDVMILADSDFGRSCLERAALAPIPGAVEAWLCSPEDIILNKLLFYREGRSDKHIRDIAGVLKIQAERIDRAYILGWVERFGLHAEWQLALDRLATPFP